MRPSSPPEHPPPPRRPRPGRATRARNGLVSDAEYRRRYENEVRRYVDRFGPIPTMGPGEAYLSSGRWVWIEGGAAAVARWCHYASLHRGLKVMDPDGTWRPWDPRTVR